MPVTFTLVSYRSSFTLLTSFGDIFLPDFFLLSLSHSLNVMQLGLPGCYLLGFILTSLALSPLFSTAFSVWDLTVSSLHSSPPWCGHTLSIFYCLLL